MKMLPQQYCLRWKHHHSNVQSMFSQLLEKERFCDVTLYCSPSFSAQIPEVGEIIDPRSIRGVSLRAHRVVLASCSELLGALLGAAEADGEPVLVVDGARPEHLRALLDYMYTGEMNVHHAELPGLLKTAEELKIKGLTDIRWNNKDEPPDSQTGAITATSTAAPVDTKKFPFMRSYIRPRKRPTESELSRASPEPTSQQDKCNVNGGPPPLIKISHKDKSNRSSPQSPSTQAHCKRENNSDTETSSPKRHRNTSVTEPTDDEEKDREHEWKHGKLNMSVCPVGPWRGPPGLGEPSELRPGEGGPGPGGSPPSPPPEGDGDDDSMSEWGDHPADIGSFLHTRLQVDGDNSGEESSLESPPASTSNATQDTYMIDLLPNANKPADLQVKLFKLNNQAANKSTIGPKSGPTDPRFTDVVKLNDYLRHGRRPQFWEEDYVRRVMEAVRLKELEMKQAAEILGVSYGTLYGRYRDVYGCINRPYRGLLGNVRELANIKGPTEILERLQRGDIPTDVAAQALGVSARDLATHLADLAHESHNQAEFEPIPIEVEPLLQMKEFLNPTAAQAACLKALRKVAAEQKPLKKITAIGALEEELPVTAIEKPGSSGKWPIRVANVESLRASSSSSSSTDATCTSPTILMKSRPDLTIVAAKKPEPKGDSGENGT